MENDEEKEERRQEQIDQIGGLCQDLVEAAIRELPFISEADVEQNDEMICILVKTRPAWFFPDAHSDEYVILSTEGEVCVLSWRRHEVRLSPDDDVRLAPYRQVLDDLLTLSNLYRQLYEPNAPLEQLHSQVTQMKKHTRHLECPSPRSFRQLCQTASLQEIHKLSWDHPVKLDWEWGLDGALSKGNTPVVRECLSRGARNVFFGLMSAYKQGHTETIEEVKKRIHLPPDQLEYLTSLVPPARAIYTSLSEAYLSLLGDVYYHPDHVHEALTREQLADHQRQFKVTQNPHWYFNKAAKQEKVDYSFIIKEPRLDEVITTNSAHRNQIIYDYSARETVLFDAGDCTTIKNLSKVWGRIQNPDGTVNANYGYMVYHLKDAGNSKFDPGHFTSQWDWAKNRLLLKKCTNQAYLHFNRPKDQWEGNLDQPCCLNIQFFIRNDRLCLNVNMRSNDAVYGVPYNLMYMVKLMHRMREELLPTYPQLTIGDYHYHALSLHFYLKHKEMVQDMLGLAKEEETQE